MNRVVGFAALALALSAIGCPSRKAKPARVIPPSPSAEPDVSTNELRRELESTVLEILGQLTLGNVETYADGLRRGKPVTLVGLEARGTFVGDGRDVVGVKRWPLIEGRPEFLSKNLDLDVARAGDVAWTYDEVSYRVRVDGRVASLPLRLTLLLTRDIDRWVVAHDHWSFPLSASDIAQAARSGKGAEPAQLEPMRATQYADTLVKLVGRLVNGDTRAREGRLSKKTNAIVVLPGIDGEYRGQAIARSPTLTEMFEGAETVGLREYRVEAAASGEVAWMVANLVVRGRAAQAYEIHLRATYVFEHSQSGWAVVHSHVSAPLASGYFSQLLGINEPSR